MSEGMIEVLEPRQLLSATLSNTGALVVAGTNSNDTIVVHRSGSTNTVTLNGKVQTLNGGLSSVTVDGFGGDDKITLDTSITVPTTLRGGLGKDTIFGGAGADNIQGADGNDSLVGNGGADSIDGGSGDDLIFGNAGNDTLLGGSGNDSMLGGDNDDSLDGADGIDTLMGENGNDLLRGGTGADVMSGGAQIDTVTYSEKHLNVTATIPDAASSTGNGTAGENDSIASDVENLTGGFVNDNLTGNGQANVLDGGAGNDVLNGQGGTDSLIGGLGNDVLNGGAGTDTADYSARTDALTLNTDGLADSGAAGETDTIGTDIEVVQGGSNSDLITGSSANQSLSGNGGNDTLVGGGGDDDLHGGAGLDTVDYTEYNNRYDTSDPTNVNKVSLDDLANDGMVQNGTQVEHDNVHSDVENVIGWDGKDSIVGNSQDNYLDGRGGNDTIDGMDGKDTILGGDGDDSLMGGLGDDIILGQEGMDTISGGDGWDTIDGGAGQDSLMGDGGDDYFINSDKETDFIDGGTGTNYYQDTTPDVNSSGGQDNIIGDVNIYDPVSPDAPTAVDDFYDTNGLTTAIVRVARPHQVIKPNEIASPTQYTIDVLSNDTNPETGDNSNLTITDVSDPQFGTTSIVNNEVVYTPDDSFSGSDDFVYQITNGNGTFSTAHVTIFTSEGEGSGGGDNSSPIAYEDTIAVPDDRSGGADFFVSPLDNDYDPDEDNLSIFSFTQPAVGSVDRTEGGDELHYQAPDDVQSVNTSFTYTISDGNGGFDTATIFVNPDGHIVEPTAENFGVGFDSNNPAPVHISLGDHAFDADGDGVFITYAGGEGSPQHGSVEVDPDGQGMTYTADSTYDSSVQFDRVDYTVNDGHGGEASGTVFVNNASWDGGGGTDIAPAVARPGFAALKVAAPLVVQPFGAVNNAGKITVDGTNNADTIIITQDATKIHVVINGGASTDFLVGAVTSIVVNGLGGADTIRLSATNGTLPVTKPSTLNGGDGNDLIIGGNGNDFIYGGADNDSMFGQAGNDVISGGTASFGTADGKDEFHGGAGKDAIDYSHRTDSVTVNLLTGTGGATGEGDTIPQKDIEDIWGGTNADKLVGDNNANFISGGGGDDKIFGLGGNDQLVASQGFDNVFGGTGADTIFMAGDAAQDKYAFAGGKGVGDTDTIDLKPNGTELDITTADQAP